MNGYIAIEINGEKVGLKFGMLMNKWYTEKMEEDINLLHQDGMPTTIGIAYLLYYGYLNNCKAKEVKESYSFEYFLDFVELALLNEEQTNVLIEVSKTFNESRYTKEWLKRIEDATEEVKKKMIETNGSTLNPSATES